MRFREEFGEARAVFVAGWVLAVSLSDTRGGAAQTIVAA